MDALTPRWAPGFWQTASGVPSMPRPASGQMLDAEGRRSEPREEDPHLAAGTDDEAPVLGLDFEALCVPVRVSGLVGACYQQVQTQPEALSARLGTTAERLSKTQRGRWRRPRCSHTS
ncbi:unnamed protein product [Prorocentrum cordatum]|uniref:Uncharacterized protein n=1 Tax=Prorocentrum cordatum TaxID=2364126 RepID=A0ABN9XWA6_9DINO|nr:unnamed protein product [Polarella glacialis]